MKTIPLLPALLLLASCQAPSVSRSHTAAQPSLATPQPSGRTGQRNPELDKLVEEHKAEGARGVRIHQEAADLVGIMKLSKALMTNKGQTVPPLFDETLLAASHLRERMYDYHKEMNRLCLRAVELDFKTGGSGASREMLLSRRAANREAERQLAELKTVARSF